MGRLKRKCYAWPKAEKYCDGCKTNSSKCPWRYKWKYERVKYEKDAMKEQEDRGIK